MEGQRVPIQRPRLRSRTKKEVPLGSYEMFQRSSLLADTVWQKIMLGLTMRSYKEVVQQFADAYGLEKSTTCEHFIEASRKKLKELLERSLADLSIAVMVIDGTIFKGQSLVVAVGTPQISVNVQAMDAQSFMSYSGQIAQAVREAMLNLSSLNDVVTDL